MIYIYMNDVNPGLIKQGPKGVFNLGLVGGDYLGGIYINQPG